MIYWIVHDVIEYIKLPQELITKGLYYWQKILVFLNKKKNRKHKYAVMLNV